MLAGLDIHTLWRGLLWPLVRILFLVSLGILAGNLIESLNWTNKLARLARPLIRAGRLSPITGASFSMAFFSGVSSNTMLAEAFDQGRIEKRELVLANLFNSLPRYFLHLPTVFFLTAPLIGAAAFHYVSITLAAACFQTLAVVGLGRLLMPASAGETAGLPEGRPDTTLKEALAKTWQRFRRRMKRILVFTVPAYTLFFLAGRAGFFRLVQKWLAAHVGMLAWLKPQALGIVAMHVGAEFSAGLAAAGALLDTRSLGTKDVVLALIAGNVLSTPMRAARHQFPYYAGIFPPATALQLIAASQGFRVATVTAAGVLYFFLA